MDEFEITVEAQFYDGVDDAEGSKTVKLEADKENDDDDSVKIGDRHSLRHTCLAIELKQSIRQILCALVGDVISAAGLPVMPF